MKVLKSFKYRLKTTDAQEAILESYCGCTRFVWNKFLALNLDRLSEKHRIFRYFEMSFWLTLWKKSVEYEFLRECPSQVLQQKVKDLDRAFRDCFDKKQPNKKLPRWRKKNLHNSIRYQLGFKIEENKIFLPKLGWIDFFNSWTLTGKAKNITISKEGRYWFVAICVEEEIEQPVHRFPERSIAIHLGVNKFMTLSNGTSVEPVNAFGTHKHKLAKRQRIMSRRQKFSNNWRKAVMKVGGLHSKISNIRKDYLHKLSTTISKNHATIFVEDVQIVNMTKSAKGTVEKPGKNVKVKSSLNQSILDQGWGEFKRQLGYKSLWAGGKVVLVPTPYTSQTCSSCGHVAKGNRTALAKFQCLACGYNENAEINAAKNILAVGQTVIACGEYASAAQ